MIKIVCFLMCLSTTLLARDVPTSLFKAAPITPKVVVERPSHTTLTLGGIMQTNPGEYAIWINNKRHIVMNAKPVTIDHGVVIEKVSDRGVVLSHQGDKRHLHPGQAMVIKP